MPKAILTSTLLSAAAVTFLSGSAAWGQSIEKFCHYYEDAPKSPEENYTLKVLAKIAKSSSCQGIYEHYRRKVKRLVLAADHLEDVRVLELLPLRPRTHTDGNIVPWRRPVFASKRRIRFEQLKPKYHIGHISIAAPLTAVPAFALGAIELTISGSQNLDLAGLENYTRIRKLNLIAARAPKLRTLPDKPTLYSVTLDRLKGADPTTLPWLSGLTHLALRYPEPKLQHSASQRKNGLSWLAKYELLSHVELTGAGVRNLKPLSLARKLSHLAISHNPITSLAELAGMKNLRFLAADAIGPQDWQEGLPPRLERLSLRSNQLAASQLEQIVSTQLSPAKLGHLDIGGNLIADLTPIGKLVNLRSLTADDNLLNAIGPLPNTLVDANFARNLVEAITAIRGDSLRHLELSGNLLSSIAGLEQLGDLRRLSLSRNQVSDLSPLAGFDYMRSLYLDHNLIEDISPLRGLCCMAGLFTMDHNPLGTTILKTPSNCPVDTPSVDINTWCQQPRAKEKP